MGIIGRQGAKLTIVNFIGVGVGVLSLLFLYPRDTDLYGLMMLFLSTGMLFEPLASLGIQAIILRYFSKLQAEAENEHGLLLYALLHWGLGSALFAGLFYGFSPFFMSLLQTTNPKDLAGIGLFFTFLPPLVALLALQNLLNYYIANYRRIVVPGMLLNFFPKIWIPLVFLLTSFHWIRPVDAVYSVMLMVLLSVLGLLGYLQALGQLRLKPNWPLYRGARLREMLNYGAYGLLGIAGSQMAYRIDQSMLGTFLSVKAVGLFSYGLVIATTIEMPSKSVLNISAPLISSFFEKGEWAKIADHYRSIALNIFSIGLLLYLGLVLVADDVFRLTNHPDKLLMARDIAMILAFAKLIDMVTGPNDLIIGISKHYRFNMLLILALSIGNILLNFSFIQRYGVFGPAYASLVFIVAFNAAKVLFIWIKFRMLPFSKPMVPLVLSALCCVGVHWFLPSINPVVDGMLGGLLLLLGYIFPLFYWRLAPELVKLIEGGLGSLGLKYPFGKP